MDLDETPEHAAFRAEVRAFLSAHAPLRTGTDADRTRAVIVHDDDAAADELMARCREWTRCLYDNGWAGLAWPREFGGRGGTLAEMVIFAEEAADFDVTTGFFGVAQSLVGPPLMVHGTPAQQQRHLPPLLRGDEQWCQLFSEPGAGSDLAALATRAVRDGDEFVVTGQKVWSSEAQHADFGILIARTDPDVPKHRGITFFIVDMRSPGVEVRPLRQATGQAHFNEVFLDEVRIPAGNVVGEIGGGWAVTRTVLSSEAGMIGSGGSGSPAGFDTLLRTARELGRDQDPVVRVELADLWMREQVMRYLGMRFQAFLLGGRGTPPDPSVLKNFLTASNARMNDLAMQVLGPAGMVDGPEAVDRGLWASSLLWQFASSIGGGTNEVHRNMLAEHALGLPRDEAPDKDLPWSGTRRG